MSFQGLHQLNDLIFNVNKPLIGKRGVHYQKLVKDWSKIVGNQISNYTIPTKITSIKKANLAQNTLYLACNNSSLATELVYQLEIIKEQINCYFGYAYIKQIKILHAVFNGGKLQEEQEVKLNDFQKEKLRTIVSSYSEDDEIKKSLEKLGEYILSRGKS